MDHKLETAYFGAGCFWGVEQAFRQLEGVVETAVGYQGGHPPQSGQTINYQSVCTGQTGHAEVTMVKFDPQILPYSQLLEIFWKIHDPTQVNRQGPDVGDQYRSVIFTDNEEQLQLAHQSKAELEAKKLFSRPIATQIHPKSPFYKAEEYHQQYFEKKGGGTCQF